MELRRAEGVGDNGPARARADSELPDFEKHQGIRDAEIVQGDAEATWRGDSHADGAGASLAGLPARRDIFSDNILPHGSAQQGKQLLQAALYSRSCAM